MHTKTITNDSLSGGGKSHNTNEIVKQSLEYLLAVRDNTLPYEDSATTVQSLSLTHRSYNSEFKRIASQYEDVLVTDGAMALATWQSIRASQLSAETEINTDSSRAPMLLHIDIVVSHDRYITWSFYHRLHYCFLHSYEMYCYDV
jgi:hypothetical protein